MYPANTSSLVNFSPQSSLWILNILNKNWKFWTLKQTNKQIKNGSQRKIILHFWLPIDLVTGMPKEVFTCTGRNRRRWRSLAKSGGQCGNTVFCRGWGVMVVRWIRFYLRGTGLMGGFSVAWTGSVDWCRAEAEAEGQLSCVLMSCIATHPPSWTLAHSSRSRCPW